MDELEGYEENLPAERTILGCRVVLTCWACPEQYDVFRGKTQIGYLRLRHGRFTAEYPGVGGELVYEAGPEGDGCFCDKERDGYLEDAVRLLLAAHEGQKRRVYMNIFEMMDKLSEVASTTENEVTEDKSGEKIQNRIPDIQARILIDAFNKLQERYELHAGDLLVFKKGLHHGYKTTPGEVYIVVETIDPPYIDDSASSSSIYFKRKLDVRVMCVHSDGGSMEFLMDSRFFEPYTGEVA